MPSSGQRDEATVCDSVASCGKKTFAEVVVDINKYLADSCKGLQQISGDVGKVSTAAVDGGSDAT